MERTCVDAELKSRTSFAIFRPSAEVAKSPRTNWWPSARIEADERTVKELEHSLSHATRSVPADQERSTAAGWEEF